MVEGNLVSRNDSKSSVKTEIKEEDESIHATWSDILPYFVFVLHFVGHQIDWYWLGKRTHYVIWIAFAIGPLLDFFMPRNNKNLSKIAEKNFANDKRFLLPLYAYILFDLAALIWGLYVFTHDEFSGIFHRICFIISSGLAASVGLSVAHELIHRKETVHKIFGTFQFFKVCSSHILIEHVKGHHKLIGTTEDFATARLNENIYTFVCKNIVGAYKSVYKYEKERLNLQKIPALHKFLKNRMVLFSLGHALYIFLVGYLMGILGLIFIFGYTVIGIVTIEVTNYIEHYGLVRKRLNEDGVYEAIKPKHSWNANHSYTNFLLFKVQRHSDHHAHSYKPYQTLDATVNAPTMIGGYSTAFIV
jgi:alkane 1-monooxygenase